MTGIFTAQTGLPFTPILSYDPTNTGTTTARPNRIADGSLPSGQRGPNDWFNAAAFVRRSVTALVIRDAISCAIRASGR